MLTNEAATKKFSRRTRIVGAAACVATAVIAVGVGVQPAIASGSTHTAQGTPAGTAVGAPAAPAVAAPVAAAPVAVAPTTSAKPGLATPGLGSNNLIQSNAFFQQGLGAVGATVDLTGGLGLSACAGETTMRDLTNAKATGYASINWNFNPGNTLLTESAAEGATDKAATTYEKQLNDIVRSCQAQNEPAGHWYYGPAHAFTVTGGEGHWYPSYNGDGAVGGGIAVVRSGNRVATVEISGQPVDDPAYIRTFGAIAIDDLAS